ncbi:hypothetical protein V8F20_000313 [Naviculisporaceae sp. PSN 640]
MSGSGGFYKYRCKHFLTYNCNNWVYVNGAACACCLAEGRDEEQAPGAGERKQPPHQALREQQLFIQAPRWARPGEVHWDLCRMITTGSGGNDWTLEYVGQVLPLMAASTAAAASAHNISTVVSTSMVTSDTPRPVMKTTGIGTQNLGGY